MSLVIWRPYETEGDTDWPAELRGGGEDWWPRRHFDVENIIGRHDIYSDPPTCIEMASEHSKGLNQIIAVMKYMVYAYDLHLFTPTPDYVDVDEFQQVGFSKRFPERNLWDDIKRDINNLRSVIGVPAFSWTLPYIRQVPFIPGDERKSMIGKNKISFVDLTEFRQALTEDVYTAVTLPEYFQAKPSQAYVREFQEKYPSDITGYFWTAGMRMHMNQYTGCGASGTSDLTTLDNYFDWYFDKRPNHHYPDPPVHISPTKVILYLEGERSELTWSRGPGCPSCSGDHYIYTGQRGIFMFKIPPTAGTLPITKITLYGTTAGAIAGVDDNVSFWMPTEEFLNDGMEDPGAYGSPLDNMYPFGFGGGFRRVLWRPATPQSFPMLGGNSSYQEYTWGGGAGGGLGTTMVQAVSWVNDPLPTYDGIRFNTLGHVLYVGGTKVCDFRNSACVTPPDPCLECSLGAGVLLLGQDDPRENGYWRVTMSDPDGKGLKLNVTKRGNLCPYAYYPSDIGIACEDAQFMFATYPDDGGRAGSVWTITSDPVECSSLSSDASDCSETSAQSISSSTPFSSSSSFGSCGGPLRLRKMTDYELRYRKIATLPDWGIKLGTHDMSVYDHGDPFEIELTNIPDYVRDACHDYWMVVSLDKEVARTGVFDEALSLLLSRLEFEFGSSSSA